MIYLIAILLPPLALLFKGKIFQAIFNGILWGLSALFFIVSVGILGGFTFPIWIFTIIWALLSVKNADEAERHQELVDAIKSKD